MLLILRYLLSEMEKDQDCEKVRWLHHIAIPEHIVSESSLRDLCNVGIQGLEERRWKVERMKAGLEKRIQESMEAKVKSQKPEPEDADSEGPMKSKHVKTEVKQGLCRVRRIVGARVEPGPVSKAVVRTELCYKNLM